MLRGPSLALAALRRFPFARGEFLLIGAFYLAISEEIAIFLANMIHFRSLFAAAPFLNGRSTSSYRFEQSGSEAKTHRGIILEMAT